MGRTAILLMLMAGVVRADERTQRLEQRLPEEAAAFLQLATKVLGVETLEQRAPKPAGGFRIRVGKAARQGGEAEWQTRTVVSEYGFTTYGPGGALHELRQVKSVDGRSVKNPGPEALARLILAGDDGRKRELLKQFEEHGLVSAATDFGQLILLFTRENLSKYEFTFSDARPDDGQRALIFNYVQLDGGDTLTVVGKQRTQQLPLRGQVWVDPDSYRVMRITMNVGTESTRHEASVDYALSRFGAVLPSQTRHREFNQNRLAAENTFRYSNFRRFEASSEIQFEPEGQR